MKGFYSLLKEKTPCGGEASGERSDTPPRLSPIERSAFTRPENLGFYPPPPARPRILPKLFL